MIVIIFLSIIQLVLINFLINKIYILEKENKFLQEEKSSMKKIIELDKSINW
jgi:uncharacterized protein YxeA